METVDNSVSRGQSIVAQTVGGVVSPAVHGLAVLAGVPPLDAIAFGALAGAASEEAVLTVAQQYNNRFRRIQQFADVLEEEAALPIDAVLLKARSHPAKLELLAAASAGAARALSDRKIDLLARLFVVGLRDDARVDEAHALVEAVGQLEVPHLRVLAVLTGQGPHRTLETPVAQWVMPERQVWRVADITAVDPGIAGTLDVLAARLQGLGMIFDERVGGVDFEPLWTLTAFGEQCVAYLAERGAAINADGSG